VGALTVQDGGGEDPGSYPRPGFAWSSPTNSPEVKPAQGGRQPGHEVREVLRLSLTPECCSRRNHSEREQRRTRSVNRCGDV